MKEGFPMFQSAKQERSALPRIAVLIAILLAVSGAPAQANSSAAPPDRDLTLSAPAGVVAPERLLNPDGTLDMSTGFQGTLDLRGWEVILDGARAPVLKPASLAAATRAAATRAAAARAAAARAAAARAAAARAAAARAAASQVTAWYALPHQGLDGEVRALAVSGSDLYVGGFFAGTGDGALTDLGSIARYDTTTGTWHALPHQGLDGEVRALAVSGSDLYVGGFFAGTGDGALIDLGSIVRYDTTAGTWHALPHQGVDNDVRALAVSGSDLVVAGNFTGTGDGALSNLGSIVRYDTPAGAWHALPHQGVDNDVRALAVSRSDLYVGGYFTQTGDGALIDLGYIARGGAYQNLYLPLVIRQ